MVRRTSHIVFVLILFFASAQIFGQRHVFSEVRVNQSNPYVGQPVEVSLSIYTSTWFTQGVNFGNIKVNGAFTVFFRSIPSSKKINGKNYAGVTAYYNVFPYDDKDVVFPSLEFTVETPKEGDFKGVPVKVKTTERVIRVKSIPKGIESNTWLVANGLNLSENWLGNEKSVKVGDVLERKVTRKAYGTVAELIPPLIWDSIPGVSNYALRSEVNNEKTKTSIYSVRSEGTRYLFEKEGSVTIPAIEVTWWNPVQRKLFKRTLPAKSFEVLPNPDLGMLESVRDSLQIQIADTDPEPVDEARNGIFGLTWKQVVLYGLLTIVIIKLILEAYKYVFIRKNLPEQFRKKREIYRQSEPYFFKRFKFSLKGGDTGDIIEKLYQWIDRLDLTEPTLQHLARTYGNKDLISFSNGSIDEFSTEEWTEQDSNFEITRKNILSSRATKPVTERNDWINP